MDLIRINERIIDSTKVTGVSRSAEGTGCVVVCIGGFESWRFYGTEGELVWAWFRSRAWGLAGDGASPVLTDPVMADALGKRDDEWRSAFAAWEAKQELNYSLSPSPTSPGEVADSLARLSENATNVGRALVMEEQRKQAADKAAKAGGN